jgi:hypothetical protein
MDKDPGGPPDREDLLDGALDEWRRGHGGGAWRLGALERVYPFALFLWHIGPPVIVTAEHVRLHIVGLHPLGCNTGSAGMVAITIPRPEPPRGYESTPAGAIWAQG